MGAGKVLRERGCPRSEGLERGAGETPGSSTAMPSRDSPSFCLWSRNIYRHTLATGPQRSRWGPEQMPEPIGGPRTCQGSGPGMRRGPVPGRILNELPAYLHVLINHKMSPRGRIKLSISLYLLLAPRHTHCSPPLHSPASLRPQAFPLPSSLSFSKYSVHHCHGRSPEGEGKGKIIGSGGYVNRPYAFISKA